MIQGCIKPLCDLLTCQDSRTITVFLHGLEKILRADETEKNEGISEVNVYVSIIADAGGFDNIEALQIHENTQVYREAVNILNNGFIEEDDGHMLTMYDTPQCAEVSPGGFNFM